MPGNGKNGKKKKEVHKPKEKKVMLHTETKSDDRASGQQGLASSAATRVSYGQSMVTQRRMKAEIKEEFRARNKQELDANKVRHNYQIYSHYHQDHGVRRDVCLECFA